MWYLLTETSDNSANFTKEGKFFSLDSGILIENSEGKNNEIGCVFFDTDEEAISYFGLTKIKNE